MNRPTKILLLKMDHIGDALWSFPAIRTMRAAYPAAKIDMLCTPYLAEAFRQVADLSQVIEYDTKISLSSRWRIIQSLRRRFFYAVSVPETSGARPNVPQAGRS